MRKIPILVSVPHGGITPPKELKDWINLNPLEVLIDSDTWTNRIFDLQEDVLEYIDTEIARSFVDVNRSRSIENPDGIIKKYSQNGKEIWKKYSSIDTKRKMLLDTYYYPYHEKIEKVMSKNQIKAAIDCHAMINMKRIRNSNKRQPRPVFCISNRGSKDINSCNEKIITAPTDMMLKLKKGLEKEFENMINFEADTLVSINDPFRGGYITAHHGRKDIPFIQLEVNRALYLPPDEKISLIPSVKDIERVNEVKKRMFKVFKNLVE